MACSWGPSPSARQVPGSSPGPGGRAARAFFLHPPFLPPSGDSFFRTFPTKPVKPVVRLGLNNSHLESIYPPPLKDLWIDFKWDSQLQAFSPSEETRLASLKWPLSPRKSHTNGETVHFAQQVLWCTIVMTPQSLLSVVTAKANQITDYTTITWTFHFYLGWMDKLQSDQCLWHPISGKCKVWGYTPMPSLVQNFSCLVIAVHCTVSG